MTESIPSMSVTPTAFNAKAAGVTLVARPSYGIRGRPLQIKANAFAANFKELIWSCAENNKAFGDNRGAFDGQKICFFPKALEIDPQTNAFEVIVPFHEDTAPPGAIPRNFKITLHPVSDGQTINLHELKLFLERKTSMTPNILTSIVCLNVMLRHQPSILYQCTKSSIYPTPENDSQKMLISGALEVWRGFYSSIRLGSGFIYINVDSTAAPFAIPGNLHEVCVQYAKCRDPSGLTRLPDSVRIGMHRFMRGLIVHAPIIGQGTVQRSKFKIKNVSQQSAAQLAMVDDSGKKQTVAHFFKAQGFNLAHPQLPCVQLTKRAWYPLELCRIDVGNKKDGKRLDAEQIAEVLKFTTKKPSEKQTLVREGLRLLNYGGTDTVKAWNFTVNSDPININARVLTAPTLTVKDRNMKDTNVTPSNGVFDMRGKRFLKAARVDRWAVIIFDSEKSDGSNRRNSGFPREEAQATINQLVRSCVDYGMFFANKNPPIIYAGNCTGDQVDLYFKKAYAALNNQPPQLLICMVSEASAKNYGSIKSLGDCTRGCATQVLRINKARSAKLAYCNNVALKINVKMSGTNAKLSPPTIKSSDFASVPTIIFGADCAHPAPNSTSPSIAALVATNDNTATTYHTAVRVQNSREEIILELEEMSFELIKKYFKHCQNKPERILFYRDGVSEGQFAEVSVREILALKRACARLSPDYKPAVTYIIARKRHHIAFFPTANSDENAPAGTVVDNQITNTEEYDFYLLSHAGLLGTSKPTHYTVLIDENKFAADDLQQITFNLTWLYPRSLRSVSICSPAYFADLVCTRVRYHLGTNFDDEEAMTKSTVSTEKMEQQLSQHLASTRALLKPIHGNLDGSLYFM